MSLTYAEKNEMINEMFQSRWSTLGARSSVVGSGTMLQAGRSQVRVR
jgi:hypothetical protein